MADKVYKIGQILFVAATASMSVYPMQVAEVITKQTLQGNVTRYVVNLPGENGSTELESIEGQIFDSAEKARTSLIENATKTINKMIERAVAISRKYYPHVATSVAPGVVMNDPDSIVPDDIATDEEGSIMTTADGKEFRVRSVKMPDSLS